MDTGGWRIYAPPNIVDAYNAAVNMTIDQIAYFDCALVSSFPSIKLCFIKENDLHFPKKIVFKNIIIIY